MTPKERRILIVEDYPIMAHTIASRLLEFDHSFDITIRDCATTAIAELEKTDAWFRVFIDLDIKSFPGLFLIRRCEQLNVLQRCTVFTATNNPQWIAEIKRIGVLGFIKKDAPLKDFESALVSVLNGQPVFQDLFSSSESIPITPLTRRQQDVLCLLHRGYTSKKIAGQLGLSVGTVDNHIMNLVRSLGATGRTHAVAKAIELGYLEI